MSEHSTTFQFHLSEAVGALDSLDPSSACAAAELLCDAEDWRDDHNYGAAWASLEEAQRLIDAASQRGFVTLTTVIVSITLIVLIAASLQYVLSTFGAVSQAVGS